MKQIICDRCKKVLKPSDIVDYVEINIKSDNYYNRDFTIITDLCEDCSTWFRDSVDNFMHELKFYNIERLNNL